MRTTVGAVMVVVAALVSGCLGVPERVIPGEPSGPIEEPTVPGFAPVTAGERLGISRRIAMGRLGERDDAVYVLRSRQIARPEQVVVWLHGYGTNSVGGSQEWLTHLADRATVVFPVYTRPPFPVGSRFGQLAWPIIARALRRVFAEVRFDPRRLVIAGYSLGGTLANDYAVEWAEENLPKPYGVFSIFAGRTLRDGRTFVPLQDGSISSATDLVVMGSEQDLLAGTREARRMYAASKGAYARRLLLVRPFEFGDHFAPARSGPGERRVFWRPLDALLDRVNDRADAVPRGRQATARSSATP